VPKRRRLDIIESLVVEAIRNARTKQGLTKAAVSRKAGLDPTMIFRFERGEYHATLQSVLRLCEALVLSLADILINAFDRIEEV
jgi:transcriptional regulator with XRE-family HTH domain